MVGMVVLQVFLKAKFVFVTQYSKTSTIREINICGLVTINNWTWQILRLNHIFLHIFFFLKCILTINKLLHEFTQKLSTLIRLWKLCCFSFCVD